MSFWTGGLSVKSMSAAVAASAWLECSRRRGRQVHAAAEARGEAHAMAVGLRNGTEKRMVVNAVKWKCWGGAGRYACAMSGEIEGRGRR